MNNINDLFDYQFALKQAVFAHCFPGKSVRFDMVLVAIVDQLPTLEEDHKYTSLAMYTASVFAGDGWCALRKHSSIVGQDEQTKYEIYVLPAIAEPLATKPVGYDALVAELRAAQAVQREVNRRASARRLLVITEGDENSVLRRLAKAMLDDE
jgi:hypothetical protein